MTSRALLKSDRGQLLIHPPGACVHVAKTEGDVTMTSRAMV
jgi:hypothetical protein